MRHTIVSFVLITLLAIAIVADAQEFPNRSEANNSKELSWKIQGGNKQLYLVLFYMPGDDHDKVAKDLKTQVAGNTKFKDVVEYVEINAARTYQYKDILTEVGIYNEPSRMYPYVLLVKGGEGYMFRGSYIGDQVIKKIQTVLDGRVTYAQPS